MKDFQGLVLCNYHSDRVDVHVYADLIDGELSLSGQDLGPLVEESWGDSDYEYWYRFDKENTMKLLQAIHGEEDPETALLKKFSGERGCSRLVSFCEKKGIQYSFYSYV